MAAAITPTFFSPSPLKLHAYSPTPRFDAKLKQKLINVRAQDQNRKGWFYDTFVSNQTMDAKLDKFKDDVAARNGYVGSWFNDSFKYTAWIEVHRKLTERNLKSIECQEAYNKAKFNGAVLLDVREPQDFKQATLKVLFKCRWWMDQAVFFISWTAIVNGEHFAALMFMVHAEGAWNVPLFQLIQGNSLAANMRRLGYALLTDFAGTERNPKFINQAIAMVGGDKRKVVVVICEIGGTLLTYVERSGAKYKKFADPDRKFGRQSRSLKAVYELQEGGFTNVLHLKDGLNQWIHEGFPIEGSNT